jgi:membrane protein implicated in regulation of membrane protease activity
MQYLYLSCLLAGLLVGVRSMLVGIDRRERRQRWSAYLNLSTGAAFAATFGAAGYLLHRLAPLGPAAVLSLSFLLAAGAAVASMLLIAGWAVPGADRVEPDERYVLQGHPGRVSRAIPSGGEGEVTYDLSGERHIVRARSLDGSGVGRDAEVVIERIEDGVAYVELWATIERQLQLPT